MTKTDILLILKLQAYHFLESTVARRVYTGVGKGYRVAKPGENISSVTKQPVERYKFCSPAEELDEFGIGIGIYFRTLKAFAIVYLLAGFANILAVRANFYECNPVNDDDDGEMPSGLMQGTAVNATRDCLNFNGQVVADILVVIIFVIFIIIVNTYEDNIVRQIDNDQQTTQDYSIWVKNPPAEYCDPQDYYEFFAKFGEVCFITVAKNNGDLIDILSERKALQEKLDGLREAGFTIKDQEENRTCVRSIGKAMGLVHSMKEAEERIKVINEEVEIMAKKDYQPWKVFVTFNKEEDQQYCLTKLNFFGGSELGIDTSLKFNGYDLIVEEAPEPSSVIYTASHYSDIYKYTSWGVSFSFGAALIISGYYIIVSMVKTGNSTAVAAFVSILNSLLPELMKIATFGFEVHDTQDSVQTSILLKLLVSRCLTTTVLIYIATPFDERFSETQLWASLQVLLFDCFFGPVVRMLDPYNNIMRYLIAPGASQTQEELNHFFEASQWTLAERYTDIMKTAVVGLFFAVPVPIGLFVTSLAMGITYATDKYALIRMWARPPMLDDKLARTARYFFGATLWIHVVISMHFFANWPYTDADQGAECGLFGCTKDRYMTDEQKEAVETYTGFNITIFIIICIWFFQDYIWMFLIASGVVAQQPDDGENGGSKNIDFRHVDGEYAYVPTVDRIELADDCLCVDVTGIPKGRFPEPLLADDKSLPKKHRVDKAGRRLSRAAADAVERGEVVSVVSANEFKFLTAGSAEAAAVLKNIFSQIQYFEPTGFNTRVENLGVRSTGIFGTIAGGMFSGMSRSLGGVTKLAGQAAGGATAGLSYGLGGMQQRQAEPVPAISASAARAGPTSEFAKAAAAAKTGGKLPQGWEMKTTAEGRPYYVNHQTKATQWNPPL